MRTRPLRLEFAPGARTAPGLGALMLAASAIVLVAAAIHVGVIWADNAGQARTLATLDARQSGATAAASRRQPQDPAEVARHRAVRQVAHHLATPWADLLDTLESAPIESIALLSVEPSVSKRSIRLTAEARNAKEMLAYLGALQRDTRLSSVVLISHQVQLQSPGTPVRFQIQASWGALP